jgi:hypothetical protein
MQNIPANALFVCGPSILNIAIRLSMSVSRSLDFKMRRSDQRSLLYIEEIPAVNDAIRKGKFWVAKRDLYK